MTIKELIKLISEPKNQMLKVEQLQEVAKKKLEVKSYLSIKEKKNLVESIVNECVLYDEGVFKFDEIEKYVCFTMRVIEAYTNLELSDDLEVDYDLLCESGLLDIVIATFKKEYDEVNILLQMRCEYILSSNNIEAQFGKFLNNILDKIDDISDVLVNKVGDFSMDKLPISVGDINKLLEFINKQK